MQPPKIKFLPKKPPKNPLLAVTTLILVILAGCAAVTTTEVPPTLVGKGISYRLPKGKVHIVVKTTTAVTGDNEPVSLPTETSEETTVVNKGGVKESETTKNAIKLAVQQKPVNQKVKYSYEVKIEEMIVPDDTTEFAMHLEGAGNAHDTYVVKMEGPFIKEVSSINRDKTADIAITIFKTGVEIFKFAALGLPPGGGEITTQSADSPEYKRIINSIRPQVLNVDMVVDPNSTEDMAALNEILKDGWMEASVSGVVATTDPDPLATHLKSQGKETAEGIYYRPVTTRTVTVKTIYPSVSSILKENKLPLEAHRPAILEKASGAEKERLLLQNDIILGVKEKVGQMKDQVARVDLNKVLLLPQQKPMFYPINRGSFVDQKTELKFEKGVLSSVEFDKPSEVLAVAEFPLEIVKSVVSLPTELIQLKFNYSSENKKLLESQKAEVDTLKALLESQEALIKKQSGQTETE
jgi:hypothetical protein